MFWTSDLVLKFQLKDHLQNNYRGGSLKTVFPSEVPRQSIPDVISKITAFALTIPFVFGSI